MGINPAFLGHGIYTEFSIQHALSHFATYGGGAPAATSADQISRFVRAMNDLEIRSVWIQLFSRGTVCDAGPGEQLLKSVIAALTNQNINWAGWGYSSGKSWTSDKTLIEDFQKNFNMAAFVIDAEPGNKIYPNPADPHNQDKNLPDQWTSDDFDSFTSWANKIFGTGNLALTTWPILQVQDDHDNPVIKLMKIAAPKVCLFAPQAYWMKYPTTVHYDKLGYNRHEYPPNDPVSFVRMTIRSWGDAGIPNPLVISGQAYWGESEGTPEHVMTPKVKVFADNFRDWNQILGFNWYNAGEAKAPNTGSMSDQMISDIKAARLGSKPYKRA